MADVAEYNPTDFYNPAAKDEVKYDIDSQPSNPYDLDSGRYSVIRPLNQAQIKDWLAKNQHNLSYPAAWYGNEPNTFQRQSQWEKAELRVGFGYAYPYTTTSQSLAIPSLYHLVNRFYPQYVAERFFFPTTKSDLKKFETDRVPIFSMESKRPWGDFDVLGISVSFDMAYMNIIKMLHMSGIPIESRYRTDAHPLIGIGGPTANAPDVISPALDWVFIGDAEEELPKLLKVISEGKKEKKPRREILFDIATKCHNVFVPLFYREVYDDKTKKLRGWHKLRSGLPDGVTRAYVKDLNKMPIFSRPPVTYDGSSMGLGTIQVSRGCGWGSCRFSLAGGSRIFSSKGLLQIEQFKGGEKIALGNGKLSEVKELIVEGEKEVFNVLTEDGYSILATSDHRIVAKAEGQKFAELEGYNWAEVSRLTQGSKVLLSNSIGAWAETEPTLGDFTEEQKAQWEEKDKAIQYPKQMSPELAKIIGYWIPKGTNRDEKVTKPKQYQRRSRDKVGVWWPFTFSKTKPELEIREAFTKVHGKEVAPRPSAWLGWGTEPYVHGSTIHMDNVSYTQFWKNIGVYTPDVHEREIPDVIFKSTKESQRQFLRFLSDACGRCSGPTFNQFGQPECVLIEFEVPSFKLMRDLQVMLLSFGIRSKLTPIARDRNGTPYKLLITQPADILQFSREIGFVLDEKKVELQKMLDERYKEEVGNKDYFEGTVHSITSQGVQRIYDISVPDGERFIANGFIAHNCEVGQSGKPYREISLDNLIAHMKDARKYTGSETVLALSFNIGEYSQRKTMIKRAVEEVCTKINISSLRVQDACDRGFVEMCAAAHLKSVAIGVEGVSQRLRDATGKGCSDDDVVQGCENLMRAGLSRIKIYMISNMSSETEEDMRQLVPLAHKLAAMKKRVQDEYKSLGKKPPKTNMLFSFTPYQASPHTPMEFSELPMDRKMVADIRDLVAETGMKIKFGPKGYSDEYYITQILTRGDRRVFPAMVKAVLEHGGYHFTFTERGLRYIMEEEMRRKGGVDFPFYFRGWTRDTVRPYEYIDIGITRDYLWEQYERYLMSVPGAGCNQLCTTCGGCDPDDLKRRMAVKARYLDEPDVDLGKLKMLRDRGNAQKIRAKVHVRESRRFVAAKFWKYAYRRSCFINGIQIDDRGPFAISTEVKINNFVYGTDYVDMVLVDPLYQENSEPEDLREALNSQLEGATITKLRILGADRDYVSKLYDSCFYEMALPYDNNKIAAALRSYEQRPAADPTRIAYFNQDTSEWKPEARKALTAEKKVFMKANPTIVQVKVPGERCEYELQLLDLKDAVRKMWTVERNGRIYLRVLAFGNVTPYDVAKGLFGVRPRMFYHIPARRIDYVMKQDSEGDLDMFRPMCATCGNPIETNLFDEPLGKEHCLEHQVAADEFDDTIPQEQVVKDSWATAIVPDYEVVK